MAKDIEVEIRSFISEEQYEDLMTRFKREAEFIGEDEQITYYFDSEQDLRIQKNDNFSKIWLKKGKIHDDHREEIEIRCDKGDFEKMERLFLALGYGVQVKWFRKRNNFRWDDIDVSIDHTKGYGHIIELEKMSTEKDKEKTLVYLKEKFNELDIEITPKEKFNERYEYYVDSWKELTKD